MGLFDKLFGKKNDVNEVSNDAILAVVDGKKIPAKEIPDPVFGEEMMGKTIGIIPNEGKLKVVSPANGVAEVVFPTGHAFGIKTHDGLGILVHIGIDTVSLKGKGFKVLCEQGKTVKAGQPMVEVDFDYIKEVGLQTVTMMVITENPTERKVEYTEDGPVVAGQLISK